MNIIEPKPSSFLENELVILSSGCKKMDVVLQGGFASGLVTEIVGEAGAGKTQLCMQLLLQAQLPLDCGGLNSSTCYISTENMSLTKRLYQLAVGFKKKHRSYISQDSQRWEATQLMENIYFKCVKNVTDLLELLTQTLPLILSTHGIKLVIIDSIAAILRHESVESTKELFARSKYMYKISQQMRRISSEFQIIFVVVNQVTDVFGNLYDEASYNHPRYAPALGLCWANCINQRIMLSRCESVISAITTRRKLQVLFSPFIGNESCYFSIEADGLRAVEDNLTFLMP